jgi:hypothetical protein
MFQCEQDLLLNSPETDQYLKVASYVSDWHLNKGKEVNNNFSFDNWKLVACWIRKFNPGAISALPLFGRHSIRSDNFFMFFYMKYPLLGIWFLWIPSLAMIISMLRVWRTNKEGNRYIDTDGKIISYFIVRSFNMRLTKFILDLIVNNSSSLLSWGNIFTIYFPKDHYVLKAFDNRVESK